MAPILADQGAVAAPLSSEERWQEMHEKLLVHGGYGQRETPGEQLSEPDQRYNQILSQMDASRRWDGESDLEGQDQIAHVNQVNNINEHIKKINAWHMESGKINNRAGALSSLQKGLQGELPSLLHGMQKKHEELGDTFDDDQGPTGVHLRKHIGLLDAQLHGREASNAHQVPFRSGSQNTTHLTKYKNNANRETG